MDSKYTQTLRYKLQKRTRSVASASHENYHAGLCQFWAFLHSQEMFQDIISDLKARCPAAETDVKRIVEDGERLHGLTWIECAALAYWVIRFCVESDEQIDEATIGFIYTNQAANDEGVQAFHEVFVEPLYEYIDESLDDVGATLGLIRRYKHRSEWFRRSVLFDRWTSDTQRGEKNLALDLYEYLYEQGLEFYIEPSSISGEVDLISSQEGDDRLLADAKIFDPGKGKDRGYLARGVKQLYTYACDFNEPVAYLVIYNTSGLDLRFQVSGDDHFCPSIRFNNKTIFLIVIDIYPYDEPASKRKKLKPYVITEQQLVGEAPDEK